MRLTASGEAWTLLEAVKKSTADTGVSLELDTFLTLQHGGGCTHIIRKLKSAH